MTQIDTRPSFARSRRRRPPKIRSRDVRATLLYTLSALTVRLVPQRWWEGAAKWLTQVAPGYGERSGKYLQYRDGFRAVHGSEIPDLEISGLFERAGLHSGRGALCLAASRRRHGWNPVIDLVGTENLERAIAHGKGVILWFDNLPLSSIVGKRAFADAGYRMWYLSGYAHGFSYTRFANRFLNWRLIEVERRYLAGRIVFSEDSVTSATRRIVEILKVNGIVGIANNAVMGKTISVPFHGTTHLKIARTPLNIAASRGAILLPVAVLEIEPFVRFEVKIGPPISTVASDDGDPTVAMALAYARYLLPLVKTHPDKWDWGNLFLQPH